MNNTATTTATAKNFAICFEGSYNCYHLLGGDNAEFFETEAAATTALYNLPSYVGYFVMDISKIPQVGAFSEDAKRVFWQKNVSPCESWVICEEIADRLKSGGVEYVIIDCKVYNNEEAAKAALDVLKNMGQAPYFACVRELTQA